MRLKSDNRFKELTRSCNMNDADSPGRSIRYDNPVARRPSPPVKRDEHMCIICLEECSGLERENTCIVGGSCKYCAHELCLGSWFEVNLACPVCRGTVEDSAAMIVETRMSTNVGVSIDVGDIDTHTVGNTSRRSMNILCIIIATIATLTVTMTIYFFT